MKNIAKLYASYDVRGLKGPVYTIGLPASEIYDIVYVEIPGHKRIKRLFLNELDALTLELDTGYRYMLNEVLTAMTDDAPCIRYAINAFGKLVTVKLPVINKTDIAEDDKVYEQ